eukprot:CAMPEP_0194350518 /NCGR_PEP_ID=MMETSP0171-20130528/107680_1 /TAXON_ID=218684 /ORGANISM="Corethron pennatum, Strain L29A3" /LENGTH=375 /DNA_ID=CAMNT_0039118071 /DNA_START=45 /DNA_END=1169 /DNA_ORIENTATION=-
MRSLRVPSRCRFPLLPSPLASLGTFTLRATYRQGRPSRLLPLRPDGDRHGSPLRGGRRSAPSSDVRTLTLSYTRPLPLVLMALSALGAGLSVALYAARPRAILTCTRHEAHLRAGEQEDNDCTLVRTVRAGATAGTPWELEGYAGGRGAMTEFQFEIEEIFMGVDYAQGGDGQRDGQRRGLRSRFRQKSVAGNDTRAVLPPGPGQFYLSVDGRRNVRHIRGRELSSVNRVSHRHTVLSVRGDFGEGTGGDGGRDESMDLLSSVVGPCTASVLMRSNTGRVYPFFSYPCPSTRHRRVIPPSSYPAAVIASTLAAYLEESAAAPHARHHIDLAEDGIGTVYTYLLWACAIIGLAAGTCLVAHERAVVDADAGTVSIV